MARPNGSDASWRPVLYVSLLVGMAFFSLSTMMLLFFAMLPSMVAYIIDRSPQRYATYCVGGFNFCGTFPSLMDLWSGGATLSAAGDILTDVFALAVIYGSAAFGWMVFMGVPPVIGAALTVLAQRRIQRLRAAQRQLLAEWGDGLAASVGSQPPDTLEGKTASAG